MADPHTDRPSAAGDPVVLLPHRADALAPVAADRSLIIGAAEAESGSAGSTTLSLSAILRYKWTMLGVFAVLTAVSVPAIWLLVKPFYSTFASIRIAPIVPRIIFDTEDNGVMPLYHSFVSTQLSVVRSPDLLRRVVENGAVAQTEWANAPPSFWHPNETLLERLRDAMNVRRRPGTEIVTVHIRANKASDAKLIADTVVDEYKKMADEQMGVAGNRKLTLLNEELNRLEREIEGLVDTRYTISKKIGTLGPEDLRSQMAQRLKTLEDQQTDVERRYALLTWELDRTNTADARPANGDSGADEAVRDDIATAQQRFASDTQWRNLYAARNNARHQLELARQKFGEQHPRIRELTANVTYAEGLLTDRERELRLESGLPGDTTALGPNWDLARQRERLEKEMQVIRAEADEQRDRVANAGEIAREMAKYDELIRRKRNLMSRVRSRIEALEVESKAPARITVNSHALLPGDYASDRRFLLTALAVMAAAMAGAAVSYLRTTLNPKIVGASDVQHTVRVPFLGQLPPLQIVSNDLTDYDPGVLESMRMVRTALLERVERGRDQVVLITSSTSGVGKTTVATLLACSLARLGKRTLLVDTDLRTASLSRRLAADQNNGLACLLNKTATDTDVITPGPVPKLDLVPAGKNLDQFDPELLANGEFSASLRRWRKQYDFILLDSPPVLPVADARILASQADGTLMVLRSSHCRRTDVTHAYADLGAAGGKLLGTVLVGVRHGDGYGYSYGYGYGYGAYGGRPMHGALPHVPEPQAPAGKDA